MTRKERVVAAVNHKETDIVPYNIFLTSQAAENVIAYTNDPDYPNKMGNHFSVWNYGHVEEIRPGYIRDVFGVVWNRTGADKDIGVVEEYLIPEPDVSTYTFPAIDEKTIKAQCETVTGRAGDTCVIGAIGFSMFERAWTLRGMENLLADMIVEPDFVHALMDAICEHNLRVLDVALDYGFDGFYFGDDWGQQTGTIMGPGHWRTFIKPRMAKMYAKVKSSGKFVVQHSCGDIREIFPDVIEIGLDLYQTFQPEIYDLAATKKEYGRDLAFWGGISTQRALPYVTPDEVKKIAKDTMDIMAQGGGFVAAPTHDVPNDVPPENIVALVEAFHDQ